MRPAEMTASELKRRLDAGEISSEEVLRVVLEVVGAREVYQGVVGAHLHELVADGSGRGLARRRTRKAEQDQRQQDDEAQVHGPISIGVPSGINSQI